MGDGQLLAPEQLRACAIAFYLPQFYPIPENDKAWGEGFTEWVNVRNAKPLFHNHEQPKIPTELGYYSLEDPTVQIKQAQLAKEYGISGFAYWYYWMGYGKRLLEKPLDSMLNNPKVDIPFCLAWANESWTGVWHGRPDQPIAIQRYGDDDEIKLHAETLANYMQDPRYIKVNSKPIFLVYKPFKLPSQYLNRLRHFLKERGITIYAIAIANELFDWQKRGYDALNINLLGVIRAGSATDLGNRIIWGIRRRFVPTHSVRKISYASYARCFARNTEILKRPGIIPTCVPNWDNSPRCGKASLVLTNSNPELYGQHLNECIKTVEGKKESKKLVFIKSWNEWAEGNYLEPDQKHGRQYLEMTKDVLSNG